MNALGEIRSCIASHAESASMVTTALLTLGLALVIGSVALHSKPLTAIGLALFGLSATALIVLLLLAGGDDSDEEDRKRR